MDKKKILDTRRELLERASDELNEAYIAADIREPQTEGDAGILSVIFDEIGMRGEEAFGEFLFLPIADGIEPNVQHFVAVITIADDLETEHLPELFEAMSYINAQLVCGSYSIDMDKKFLSFKMTVPLPINMPEEELYEEINIVISNAMTLVDLHIDLLTDLIDGDTDLDYIKEVLKTNI